MMQYYGGHPARFVGDTTEPVPCPKY